MKRNRAVSGAALLLVGLAGVAWMQVGVPRSRALAERMPTGSLVYLEAKDFGSLLREWQGSATKGKWLASANYQVFSQSNLFQKLTGVYQEYQVAAGFAPGLGTLVEVAGTESAMALYDARALEFVYLTKLPTGALTRSALWGARGQFEERQAAGIRFWLRQDAASGKTVAFAAVNDWLLVATRADLMARALALTAENATEPKLADEGWYRDAAAATGGKAGELRMVLNLPSLVGNTYFRSYWIQRNVSEWNGYRGSVADLDRAADQWTERRVFLRDADAASDAPTAEQRTALAQISASVPGDVGVYRAWAGPSGETVSGLVGEKLLFGRVRGTGERLNAPPPPPENESAGGTEDGDLQARIDAPSLPATDQNDEESIRPLRALFDAVKVDALLEVQGSALPAGSDFLSMPCVLVMAGAKEWDAAAVKRAVSEGLAARVSTGAAGTAWSGDEMAHVEGLASLFLQVRGRLLFVGNDAGLMGTVTGAHGTAISSGAATYLAGYRNTAEQTNLRRLFGALGAGDRASTPNAPTVFSNIASLSEVLGFVQRVEIERAVQADRMTETVRYRF